MWVGRIRRCRRRSSTCEGWSRVFVVVWLVGILLVCVDSLFSGWLLCWLWAWFGLLGSTLVICVVVLLLYLVDLWVGVYFRDEPARALRHLSHRHGSSCRRGGHRSLWRGRPRRSFLSRLRPIRRRARCLYFHSLPRGPMYTPLRESSLRRSSIVRIASDRTRALLKDETSL